MKKAEMIKMLHELLEQEEKSVSYCMTDEQCRYVRDQYQIIREFVNRAER